MVQMNTLKRYIALFTGVLIATMSTQGQIQATESAPSFEVTTVKLFHPSGRTVCAPGSSQMQYTVGTVQSLIAIAYKVKANPSVGVLGGPAWVDRDLYEIEARIPDEVFLPMQSMTNGARVDQVNLMMQSLLVDRSS